MLSLIEIAIHILAILSASYFNAVFLIYSYTFYVSSAFIADKIS